MSREKSQGQPVYKVTKDPRKFGPYAYNNPRVSSPFGDIKPTQVSPRETERETYDMAGRMFRSA